MADYLRARHGNTFFFTVVTYGRQPILCLDQSRPLLRQAIHHVRQSHPFLIHAWVLLPDHMHCIWQLPDGDTDYSKRWGIIKSRFSKGVQSFLNLAPANNSRRKHRELTVWQRRFWEHMIRDEGDYTNHCHYIHYNPVKHGLVTSPGAWPYSTIHRFMEAKMVPPDWGMARGINIPDGIGRE